MSDTPAPHGVGQGWSAKGRRPHPRSPIDATPAAEHPSHPTPPTQQTKDNLDNLGDSRIAAVDGALDPAAADAAAAACDAADAARGDGFVQPARNAVDYSGETELAADAALQAAR